MIALKVEELGGQAVVVLSEEALAALHLAVGDTLQLDIAADGTIHAETQPAWLGDPHARGRAFLRRYNKSFTAFEG